MSIPCPHFKITITQRSKNQSAVAGAAYQSGESLFSEYDRKRKSYSDKRGIVYTEIMLPANAPPEYMNRNTLWNAVERKENQWNSQLARRIVLALPVEVPAEQYPQMLRDLCKEQFVDKGMCADFAIHDKGDGNPHAHIMLTMRAMDEHGRWLPKTRKVYDLDENGQRYKCPNSRYWASHKEDTVDWNDRKYGEIWRHAWEVVQNRYLENNDRPERVDMRSYERQGIDKIPTVHMGPAVFQMERRGIETNIGNLNRDIKAANNLMASIRLHIRQLKDWLDKLMTALEKLKEPTVPELLSRYVQLRMDEREGWSSHWRVQGLATDLNKLSDAKAYLKKNRLLTLDEFENRLANIQGKADKIRGRMKEVEKRMRVITDALKAYDAYVKLKPVFDTYSKKGFKKSKEKYAAEHAEELAAMKKAYGYLMKKHGSVEVSVDALQAEYAALKKRNADDHARLEEVQTDLRVLKDIRYRISKVLPHRPVMDEPQTSNHKKPSVLAKLKDAPVSDKTPKQPQRSVVRADVEL